MASEVAKAKLDIIKQELGMVQSSIDKYDDINFRIRGWEVTIWSALMVVFFQTGKNLVPVIAMLVPLIFWALDGLYKSFRESYKNRKNKISMYLSSKNFEKEFNSGKISFESPTYPTHKAEDVFKNCFRSHVFLLHVLLFVIAAVMYFWLV